MQPDYDRVLTSMVVFHLHKEEMSQMLIAYTIMFLQFVLRSVDNLFLLSSMTNTDDYYGRIIFLITLEDYDIAFICIANVHSIVIYVLFISFFVLILACSSLFSDILDSLFVLPFVIV